MGPIFLYFSIAMALFSCDRFQEPGTPLAKVRNQTLTLEELQATGITQRDSVEQAIADWVNNEILYQEAKSQGLLQDSGVQALLRDAQRKILLDAYQRRVLQNLNEPEEGELEAYYEMHRNAFPRKETELRFSRIVFPNWDAAYEAYRNRTSKSWGDLRQRFDPGIKDTNEASLPWQVVSSIPSCIGNLLSSLTVGAISSPQQCDGRPIMVKLHEKRDAGETMNFEEARASVLEIVSAQKRSGKLDSLLQEAKSRQPVFTWPENLPKP
ncbi:MAG TPA: peptidylprolyl isomerase [Fibrobacteraceae bacterium]|nr:peptidylprolyl isomerase [Fibrobacteraceae bacterium]